jgi:hypothetical protein
MHNNIRVFTIGHSNRKWSDFISILKENNVDLLVDVRRYPGSRVCPQFNKEQMTTAVQREDISTYILRNLAEDETTTTNQIAKQIGVVTMVIIGIVDGKIRALGLMLVIWQLHPLEKVSTNYLHLREIMTI